MRHLSKIDGFSIIVESALRSAIALVISEAVLDADNDPARDVWLALARPGCKRWYLLCCVVAAEEYELGGQA